MLYITICYYLPQNPLNKSCEAGKEIEKRPLIVEECFLPKTGGKLFLLEGGEIDESCGKGPNFG